MFDYKGLRIVAGAVLVGCLAITSPALSQSAAWTEDKDDDAGSGPRSSQKTKGSGDMKSIQGAMVSSANFSGGRGGSSRLGTQDGEDLFLIWVANPETFNASLQSANGGFANFPNALYLFDVGVRAPNPDIVVEAMNALLGNRDESGNEGAFLPREATDNTSAKVSARGYYVLAVTSAPRQPEIFTKSGAQLPMFSFETSSEVSGPDGEGGSFDATETNLAWIGTEIGGVYEVGLDGIAFAVPLDTEPITNAYPPAAEVSLGQYPVTLSLLEEDGIRSGCVDQDGNNIEFFNNLWWNFEAKDTGDYVLSTCNETQFPSVIGVYKDSGLCRGDINGDGTVNTRDFSVLLVQWGSSGPEADLNFDGTVNFADFQLFLTGFGECIPVPELVACSANALQCEGGSELVWFANQGDRYFLRVGTQESTSLGSAVLKVGPSTSGQ